MSQWETTAVLSLAVMFGAGATIAGQESETVRVTAGERYATSHAGQDWLLGADYRDLWAEPIEVAVLDLEETAGGLTPVMRVGGLQTLGLALAGENGRAYTFRSVDKEGLLVLPDAFNDTGLEYIIKDQVSSALPAADLIAFGLADVLGVLHSDVELVVMPDDARLGEYREAFAGLLGTFYEFPTSGSFGSIEVYDDDDFIERTRAGEDYPDSRAFLRARLLDVLIGDWDRHYGQWRWARIPNEPLLKPIPEDRDQAFSHYDGLAMAIARAGGGQMTVFEDEYPGIHQLAFNGADFDRIVLNDIERSVWMAIAEDVQRRIDDDAIHRAVSRLPPPYYALRGDDLERTLRARRDGLFDYAEVFYEFLANQVDVHATDRDERVRVERFDGGAVEVRVTFADEQEPYYQRRFDRDDTDDVRIYLRGGDDRVVVDGAANRDVRVRIITGPGTNAIEGPRRGSVQVFEDPDGDGYITQLTPEDVTGVFSPVLEANWKLQVPGAPYRDWGVAYQPIFFGKWHPDLGLALGGGVDMKQFGFGKLPWAARHRLWGAYAIGSNRILAAYEGDFRRIGGGPHFETDVRVSGLEQLRYYGLGNETSRDGPTDRFKAGQREHVAAGYVAWGELTNPVVRVGPIARFVNSRGTDDDTLLAIESPYGFDAFGQLGLRADFTYDSRRELPTLSSGFDFLAAGTYYPELWDVERDYGVVEADGAGHIQLARPLTLALLFGGRKAWGEYPYFDAAYLGGEDVFGAYDWNRFAGDAMVRAGVRLRWAITQVSFTVPGDLGLTVRADTGRAFLEGEDSSLWHSQFMIGAFYTAFDRLLLFEAGIGWSDERTVFEFEIDFDWLMR